MLEKYIISFLISMVPILEIRGGMVYAVAAGLPEIPALIVCMIGNMLPVPFIYFFARKVLVWGSKKKFLSKPFTFILEKGEKAGQALTKGGHKNGLFIALMLFVGIPLPGTGAWTGTLGASLLDVGIKRNTVAVSIGVVMAGIIMTIATHVGLGILGL